MPDLPDLPPDHVLRWAAQAVGAGATVEQVRRLREDEGPWLLRLTHGRSTVDAILRTGPPEWHEIRTEAAALALAEEHGLPTPRLLAAQCNESRGYLAVLSAVLPGRTAIPRVATVERLRALGAAAAALHAVPLSPRPDLPLRTHHMPWVDRSAERHWAREYHAAAEPDRSAVVTAWLRDMPGPSHDEADAALREVRSTPLLDKADARLRAMNVPHDETVFVHGDLWHANTMWDGDSYVGMIDLGRRGGGSLRRRPRFAAVGRGHSLRTVRTGPDPCRLGGGTRQRGRRRGLLGSQRGPEYRCRPQRARRNRPRRGPSRPRRTDADRAT
ncbi:MAG: phosphotransferase [Actinopolymorphaceae bacterium]